MLGVPICQPNDSGSTRLALSSLVEGFEASLHALGRLPDPQIQLRLLRVCLDACRLNHVFRAADCTGLTALVSRASGALRGCLEGVTGFSLLTTNGVRRPCLQRGGVSASPTQSKCATSPACPRVCHGCREGQWG